MEMTAVWEERKRKSPFPLFPHGLGKLANSASFPHSHSFADDWRFPFFSNSFNFNSTRSVTYMPGTFCYRHARPHTKQSISATRKAVSRGKIEFSRGLLKAKWIWNSHENWALYQRTT
jgi:hypothetical protein